MHDQSKIFIIPVDGRHLILQRPTLLIHMITKVEMNIKLLRHLILTCLCVLLPMACTNRNAQKDATGNESAANNESVLNNDSSVSATDNTVSKPTVIDFYADWCGPCRQIAPLFEELESEYGDRIQFSRVNVDDSAEHAARYGITSIPTFIFLDAEGKLVATVTGADPVALQAEVKKLASY